MNVADLLGLPQLNGDLARAEDALRDAVASMDPFLAEVGGHLVEAGGKRLRPALAMVAAVAGGAGVTDDVVQGGVAAELVHIGSLYHDDVMDEAGSRRGVVSVNARWGNLVAILAGDFLLAKASEIAASLGGEVARLLAHTIGELCEGQLAELRRAFQIERTEDEYLSSIDGKTASLVAASCRIGALAARLPAHQVAALDAFGRSFGMAFQIRDDVFDITCTEEELGKPVGQDLLEGTYSLPIIRALAMREPGAELRPLLGKPVVGPESDKAKAIIRESGSIEEALEVARGYGEVAAAALAPLGENSAALALANAARRLADTPP